jgi:glycine dehydrogenase subunit 1
VSYEQGHPYIPNSAPASRADMLAAVGAASIDDLYASVPVPLRIREQLDLPPAIRDELALRRHVSGLLDRDTHAGEVISFLGGGTSTGTVPAVVDEIVGRAEFVTAYGGTTYGDLGKYQAIFEFQSLVGELVGMDVVSTPLYDGITATSSALLMAARLTGRGRVLVPETSAPELRQHLAAFARRVTVDLMPANRDTGLLDLPALSDQLDPDVAAVLVENPSFLGHVEAGAPQVARMAHAAGALCVVSADPSLLGILAAPAEYGADIVTGDAQSLGVHALYGGGQVGFIAHRDEPEFVRENPAVLVSAVPARDGTGIGYAWVLPDHLSYELRGDAQDFTGTSQWLWGIAAAVHLSLLGAAGLREHGEGLAGRALRLKRRLSSIQGVRVAWPELAHPREQVVCFPGDGPPVDVINARLREHGIHGGQDLSGHWPWLGRAALYAVTDAITAADIDRLADALEGILR